ncbi:MAG TPA: nuclear transport factor 2 family protein, partial [Thermomicrobiales bacterium]|nr:nuclear transport factor 2 family protein [Thermomicrobiales bacterium]
AKPPPLPGATLVPISFPFAFAIDRSAKMATVRQSLPIARPPNLDRRRPALAAPLAAAAALATALALLAIAVTLFGPVVALGHADDGASANLIRRFYDVANRTLAGGDQAALAVVVAPDLIAHDGSSPPAEPPPLAQRLAALRAAAPDARFVVGDVMADGDRVAARVEIDGTAGAPELPVVGPPELAAGTELFRIVNGRIAEYWPLDAAASVVRALPPLPVGLWQGTRHVGIARFDLPAAATIDDLQGPWPHVLVGVAGNLTVTLRGGASLARAETTPTAWEATAPGGQTVVLRPGDALAIPAGLEHALRNDGDGPAAGFGVLAYAIGDLLGNKHYPAPAVSDLLSIYNSGFIGRRVGRGSNATTQVVGSESDVTQTPTARALMLAWLPLTAAQTIPVHRIDGVEALVPLSGMLLIDRSPQGPVPPPSPDSPGDSPAAEARRAAASVAPRPGMAGAGYVPASVRATEQAVARDALTGPAPTVLMAGEATTFSTGWSARTRSLGAAPTQMLTIRIANLTTGADAAGQSSS